MSARLISLERQFWIWGLALVLPTAPMRADSIRVTTWDLRPAALQGTNGWSDTYQQGLLREAAESLTKLNADVILLQQVAGWKACHQLAQALQPENYQVVICSSFRDPAGSLLRGQVAILCKAKAYLAWSEAWQTNGESPAAQGGFAFAAVPLDGKNVGLFSVQISDPAALLQAREESARQLVKQVGSLQNWSANRPQAFMVAGVFNAATHDSPLENIGFQNTLADKLARRSAAQDTIFTRDAGLVASPQFTRIALCEHAAVTCDMDLNATPAPMVRSELPSVEPAANATTPSGGLRNLFWLAGGLAGGMAFLLLARKLARRSAAQPASANLPDLTARTVVRIATPRVDQITVAPPSETQPYVHIEMEGSTQTQSQTSRPRPEATRISALMPEAVRAGVVASLSRWLKQKLVQRLVSDRAQLLATQQAAALKLLTVDKRLARIERQIQQINQEYEHRIDALLKELVTAKEENRELIRAKIALVREEMEKARLNAAQPPKEHQQP